MNYDQALREWGARQLDQPGKPPVIRDTVTVEYYNDYSGCETCGIDTLGVEIDGLREDGTRSEVFIDRPFTEVVSQIAAVAQENQ